MLLDTCAIIEMVKYESVRKAINDLTKTDCTLLSVSPVKDELTYGANSIEEYDDLSDFIASQEILILDETRKTYPENEVEAFRIALSRCKNISPSYVDRLLLSIPYFYRKSSEKVYIATLNHKDVPIEFYKCVGMISYCKDRTFRNIGFYEFDLEKFEEKIEDVTSKLIKAE